MTSPGWVEDLLSIRYPTYAGNLETFQGMTNLEPSFDKEGNPFGVINTSARAIWAGSIRLVAMSGYAIAFARELPACAKESYSVLCTY